MIDDLDASAWQRVVDAVEPPTVEAIAEQLADGSDVNRDVARERVEAAIGGGALEYDPDLGTFGGVRVVEKEESAESGDSGPEQPSSGGDTPTPDGAEIGKDDGQIAREAAVDALRDVIRFYHRKLDDTIIDHTEDGENPERPATAREYFEDVRGWDAETVDALRLGWAPPDHVDELVAWLFDRGHSREAMLATGAIGETDTGGLYTTFSGRYVLPYYDADGDPAYAIARVTGGDGGGAKGYGGHPRDYQAGKYAKLRHTDDRVPFDEPIYGLDTLDEADHVVVAEGVADAITAREAGYAVLSPVAKEFKEAHYDPLVDALETHNVERVTIVGDADTYWSGERSEDAPEPDSIGAAAADALADVPAGEAGALRTAEGLRSRAGGLDVRVVIPPTPAAIENDLDEFVTGWGGDLGALLRSAQPPEAFGSYEAVTTRPGPGDKYEEFDAEEYEPSATDAEETTDDIRDLFAAIDRLDAQRVAERTIVREWLEPRTEHRTFVPTWAPSGYSGTANYCDRDKWVDTGSRGGYGGPVAMAAIDGVSGVSDTDCPGGIKGETWFEAVDHLRSLGFDIPQLDRSPEAADDEEYRRDPREIEATVDPRRAWDAAGRVTAEDLDGPLPELEDVGDVARAVALAEGMIDDPSEPLDDEYPRAYEIAREQYGAPLPEYYTTADAIAEFEAVLDVIGEVTFWDLDPDALESDITAEDDEVGGAAVRALDPAWRESESGESVLVFESGNVWDADTERTLDPLRFVALDSGLIDEPGDPVAGEHFTEGYRRLRDEYDAPLPRWDPAHTDDARDATPQLPPSDELVDARGYDGVNPDALETARERVESVVAEAVETDDPTVVTSLPATGKTTSTIKAAGERPLSYLAARKELQQQALRKADKWGVDAEILPVASEARVRPEVLDAAVSHVREFSKDRLRDRWAIVEAAFDGADTEDLDLGDIFEDEEGDTDVDLDRPTCPTFEGEHGVAWALAAHVARRLGYTPREIHTQARGLFGTELPCDGSCEYSEGWDRVTDPDAPADLLVGSYVHGHVPSVSAYIERDEDGSVTASDRAIVLDEFPGEAFNTEYGAEALDFATWLASNLREDVDDRRDMYAADLYGDEFVRAWLDGEAGETDAVGDAIATLASLGDLYGARESAEEILREVDDDLLADFEILDPLTTLVDDERPTDALRSLDAALGSADRHHPAAGVLDWIAEAVRDPLSTAVGDGGEPDVSDVLDDLPVDGDLAQLVVDTVEAVRDGDDHAPELVDVATTALRGGRDGCRRLAAWADDGYAHPNAHHLLTAVITPTGEGGEGARVDTDAWAFDPDATDGTVVDVVDTTAKGRVVLDRNDHGAILHTPPAVDAPIVGLDATARRSLWSVALQEDVTLADIHDTPEERAAFLEDTLDLRVLQAADRPRFYEGDPATKDTDGDVALLEAIADEYSGIEAPRERGGEAVSVGKPAAITTKGVRELLENDERLDDVVAKWENYGNVKGANDLGGHRLAALLGCQHYGDDAIERFAALDGREIDTSRDGGRGARLEYGDDLADDYLAHMTEDQTMQAILRFARGDSGATVVARTAALRDDLPIVGEAQVVDTWSDTATKIARQYRRTGKRFTIADVRDAVEVKDRQIRRVLGELVDAGYLQRTEHGPGRAHTYEPVDEPGAGEVALPDRVDALASSAEGGRSSTDQYYTWNVRVHDENDGPTIGELGSRPTRYHAPPSPNATAGADPPG